MRISVRDTIKSKSPKWERRLPNFIMRWLEKTIHQDKMNKFLDKHFEEPAIKFAENVVYEFAGASVSAINEENIPRTGRYIVVSNHPLGAVDGLALVSVIGKYRKDIKFPVNDLLMAVEPMHGVFIPINKHGRNNSEAVRQMNEVFAGDDLIIYFPAGLCSRKINGKIQDVPWKKTIIQKAKQYNRDIIPVLFEGKNSERFYRIANIRKKLGIKINIEMLYLVDEMVKQKGNHFTATFGKPIPYSTFDNSKTDVEWAAWLQTIALASGER